MKKASKSQVKNIPIVGIGASAGGLEALEDFFSNMIPNTNLAFVIIQHLDPTRKSIMASLLQKHTDNIVVEIKDGTKIKENHIYLNPPNKNIDIINNTLHLVEPVIGAHGIKLPIDNFFRSLAEDQGEKSICIILSGTGTDGTLGLKAIKGVGGMTMVQDEKQAKYSGMPRSAIDTGMVDYVLPTEKMANELFKYVKHPYIGGPTFHFSEQQFQNYIQKIFLLIRSKTGHDFSNYKINTTRRRIERRLAVHQIDKLSDYVNYLQKNPNEIENLFKDLLIGVTNFFRDADAFKVLGKDVLPLILENKLAESNVRIWIAGCATGEEAYSIAILCVEAMETLNKHINIQIFASDLDSDAIDFARSAIYPESIVADVSTERLNKFFIKENTSYRLKKQIRDMVVFAQHNLIKDPPFTRLDLVSCRNLLIYMDPTLQKRILPLFHYTLNQDGILFLGSSESIGEFGDLFKVIDTKWKIFKHKNVITTIKDNYIRMPFYEAHPSTQKIDNVKDIAKVDIKHIAEKIILNNYAPSCVLINERYDILYFIGPTEKYLTPPIGEPSFNLLKMAREDLKYALSTALHSAAKQKKSIENTRIKIKLNGEFQFIDLVTRPLTEANLPQGLMLVIFDDKTHAETPVLKDKKTTNEGNADPIDYSLEQELNSTKEYLQATIEELETSNEELRSANEELQSVNEEMQSTNEELETSKEELQSTNEELETVNAELQGKLTELSQANNDMNNLLASTEIGTIFLDTKLCIKRFTPTMTKIFNLIQSDIGRPISHITSNFSYANLSNDVENVLNSLVRIENKIQTKNNNWYSMRIMPYRTLENVIDGVVITFIDITELETITKKHLNARLYAEAVVETIREPLVVLDSSFKVISANRSFYKTFHTQENEVKDNTIYSIGNKQWDVSQLKELLENVILKNEQFNDYEVSHNFPKIGQKKMLLNARRIDQNNKQSLILLAIEDITKKNS